MPTPKPSKEAADNRCSYKDNYKYFHINNMQISVTKEDFKQPAGIPK